MPLTRRLLLGSTIATVFVRPGHTEPADSGARVLTAGKAGCRLLPAPSAETNVLSFNGTVPGPLLRCKLGGEVKIRLVNQSDQPLTLACWGMRLANATDGAGNLTQKPVLPGQSFDYLIKPPDAGFYWYRSFVPPDAGTQLRHGLYGPFIVEEAAPPLTDREIVAVLADWQLDAKAQIIDTPAPTPGAKPGSGPVYLATINSKPLALDETLPPGSRVRLRILNAAASRMFFTAFDGVTPHVLAIDGEPCEAFTPVNTLLPIGPGGRFDVMFDLPATMGATARLLLRNEDRPDQPLIAFKTAGTKRTDLPPIASLPLNPLLPAQIRLQASTKTNLVVTGGLRPGAKGADPLALNGAPSKDFAKTPLFSVKRGVPVTLGLINKSFYAVQMHVHGHQMRVLHDLDDGWDPYWRDSVIAPQGHSKHAAFVADNPGKWAIECVPLDTPAGEMVSWFEVT